MRVGRTLIAWVAVLFVAGTIYGQVVLYQNTFPFPGMVGDFPVNTVGWANDIPTEPERLYQNVGGDGAVFAYQNAAATTAFYTSTVLSAVIGAAFPSINTALYTDITFSVDINPFYAPINVKTRFAVQMNGGNWFVSTNVLPVPATTGPFVTYSNVFNPAASHWDTLSVSGNGTGNGATIGGVASGNLTGSITGAGLVFVHAGAGTFNFDNFRITAADSGNLMAGTVSNGMVSLSWSPALNVRLQSTTNLSAGGWNSSPTTAGQSSATMPMTNTTTFFRLSAFPFGGLYDGDFESGILSADWQTSGNSSADSIHSGGAFSGSYYLLQSNATPYQVTTYQLVTNLPNGYYKLTAMVENSGGQNACYLKGNERMTSLPVDSQWTNTIVRGINVTNGQCLVSIYSDDSGGGWCKADLIQLIKDDIPYHFLKGGDISELTYVEQGGGVYYETNGAPMDCLQILKNHGFNIVRLRLYNDPSPANSDLPEGIQSPTNILALAARAKALGLQIELTFYYSDGWANTIPHAWTNYTFAQLTNAVYDFTTNFMTEMKSQGTTPEYVSLGNEINSGILQPVGGTTASGPNWPQLAPLLKMGYAGVKAVSPSTQVILHVNSDITSNTVTWFFDNAVANGVKWDIIGCSYYPFWTQKTAEQARDMINSWYTNFNKPVLIMETGYNWATNRCDGYTGQLANNGPEPFPSTPLGQKEFMLNCLNAVKMVDQGHCIGDLYWDPIFIYVPNEGWELGQPNVVDNTTLFDCSGHALPALDAFYFNN